MLEVGYPQDAVPNVAPFARRIGGFWDYSVRLPVAEPAFRLSLGEGNTPLVASPRFSAELACDVRLKNETTNPTLSFKDRYAAVSVSMAQALGFTKVVVSSTGNHGAAAAAYAARGGLTCLVLCARQTPPGILEQIVRAGAIAIMVDGPDRFSLVDQLTLHHGWFPAGVFLDTAVHNPFGIEGYKTIAYEIVRDLGDAPNLVVFPSARGNGLYGAWKGFLELHALGITRQLPRMIACQPATASSIAASLAAGHVVRVPPGPSIAASITEAVASAQAIAAVRDSGGEAVAVDDADALQAAAHLAAEGLWVEVSSATALAGVRALGRRGQLRHARRVVVVLTGAGIKWIDGTMPEVPHIHGGLDEVEHELSRRGVSL